MFTQFQRGTSGLFRGIWRVIGAGFGSYQQPRNAGSHSAYNAQFSSYKSIEAITRYGWVSFVFLWALGILHCLWECYRPRKLWDLIGVDIDMDSSGEHRVRLQEFAKKPNASLRCTSLWWIWRDRNE